MKKETTVAIVLGVTMGAVIAFILVFTTKNREISEKKVISPKVSPTTFQPATNTQLLEITEPKNDLITSENTAVIKGKGQKNSLIIIQSFTTEKTIKLDKDDFQVEYPLELGENIVRITAYLAKDSNDKILKIYRIEE